MAKNDFLNRILADKSLEVAARRSVMPVELLAARCADMPPARPAAECLRGDRLRVIAEVKRGSPSAGVFNAELDAADQAAIYSESGAAVISILTDGPHFGGSLADLERARNQVNIPLLRKDFIIDEYQLFEARAAGADVVLLIVAALAPPQLRVLLDRTAALGMTALVEVNSIAEAAIADNVGSTLVGINNRDLHTFEVDLTTTVRVRPRLPKSTIVAALSGIKTPDQARAMRDAGVDAVLVGEALVRSTDPAVLIARMTEIA